MLFPCLLYKVPGPHQHLGIRYKYIGCRDEEHLAELTEQGWSVSLDKAQDDKPMDRAELERIAISLDMKFDGRTTDKKLAERIAALGSE